VKHGFTYGATDEYGLKAVEGRMHTTDLHATLLAMLGLDHEILTYRYAGRDSRRTDVSGNVAREIFAKHKRRMPMFPATRAVLQELPHTTGWVVTAAPSKHYPKGDHQISERRLLQYLQRVLGRSRPSGPFAHVPPFVHLACTCQPPTRIRRPRMGRECRRRHDTHVADSFSQVAMRLAEINELLQEQEADNCQKQTQPDSAQILDSSSPAKTARRKKE